MKALTSNWKDFLWSITGLLLLEYKIEFVGLEKKRHKCTLNIFIGGKLKSPREKKKFTGNLNFKHMDERNSVSLQNGDNDLDVNYKLDLLVLHWKKWIDCEIPGRIWTLFVEMASYEVNVNLHLNINTIKLNNTNWLINTGVSCL